MFFIVHQTDSEPQVVVSEEGKTMWFEKYQQAKVFAIKNLQEYRILRNEILHSRPRKEKTA